MKASELREMTLEELRKLELELREKLFLLRFRAKIGQIESPMEIRKTRKDLARVLTVMREKELSATKTGQEKHGG